MAICGHKKLMWVGFPPLRRRVYGKIVLQGGRRVGEKFQFDGARMRAVELELRSAAAQAGG